MKSTGKKLEAKTTNLHIAIMASLCVMLLLSGCSKPVPNDGMGAKMKRFENLDNYRYCEVFLIGGNPITKNLSAAFYNTTYLNNAEENRDSCSDEMWAKVDKEALKKQYNLLGVFKNGPRYWMYDWIELPIGELKEFNGLQAHWFGKVKLPKDFGKKGSTYYKFTTVERKSHQGYKKGQTVFILDDPNGTPWIMQAYSRIVDPDLDYKDLKSLGTKLNLPAGWKFRVKVLDKDLTVSAIDGIARVVQDNLENTYNACFAMDNQKNCTFKP